MAMSWKRSFLALFLAGAFGGVIAAASTTGASAQEVIETQAGPMVAQEIAGGFDQPWAVGFLPEGQILVTERDGDLVVLDATRRWSVRGVPRVVASGQGGLLDVLVPRDFAESREIFMTFAKRQRGGSGTAVMRGQLSRDLRQLRNVKTIYEIAPGSSGGRHFGSRLVEAQDGTLFVTVGDRGDRPSAQDLSRDNGSVLRITRDGRIPADNPFVGTAGARQAIWSYGHRNPQGAAMDADGQLWVNEHGARGGDEVNKVQPGANYGWPVIAYGRHYSGAKIGEGTRKPGMVQPETYWDPSIAPSGMAFYDGPQRDWRGDAFVGSLKFDYIARLSGSPLREVEQIKGDATERVRDLRVGPDGALWFLSVGNGALYRLAPQ